MIQSVTDLREHRGPTLVLRYDRPLQVSSTGELKTETSITLSLISVLSDLVEVIAGVGCGVHPLQELRGRPDAGCQKEL